MIQASVDVQPVLEALKETGKAVPTIMRQAMRIIGRGASQVTNRALVSALHSNKGLVAGKYAYNWRKAYTYKATTDRVTIYPRAISKNKGNDMTVPVFSALNDGGEIKASKYKYLWLKGDGWYARSKAVRITGKHFVEVGQQYTQSDKYVSDIETLIERELKKYWG